MINLIYNGLDHEMEVDDNSYRYRAIMGENSLTLYFSHHLWDEIPVGAYVDFQGERYTLTKPQNFKKHGAREFEYILILDSAQSMLSKYKFRDTGSSRLKFRLTAQPQEHLQMLVDNLNQRDAGWSVGSTVTAAEKPIAYNHTFCSDALQMMAEAFETEWEVVGKTINLRKVEYNKTAPLPLSYGKGKGFKPGLGRTNFDSSKPVEILFIQGGERNIDKSKYGSQELLLPISQTLVYEGRSYITDASGQSIRRSDKALVSQEEDSLDLSHIYPSRIGNVSEVVTIDIEKNLYDFVDASIPENLDFEDYRIIGEEITVIFQAGMLAGKEFEANYIHEPILDGLGVVIKKGRRFEIKQQDIDGQPMPNEAFKPAVNNDYAVFGISLPPSYVCDNAAKTGASWDMFREGAKYLFENEDPRFSFTGEMDGIWAKQNWLEIGGKIKLGGYVSFSDLQFQIAAVLIRMTGIKDLINNPESPTIELSNITVGGSVLSDLIKIETNEVVADSLHKEAIKFTKRRFRDARETAAMLGKALLNFETAINPITVQTMQLLVGDESLQFRFVDNKITPSQVSHSVTFDKETKILNSPAGILQHMTIGITEISSEHVYKFWDMAAYNTPPLDSETFPTNSGGFLYAKVSATGTTGTFILSEDSIPMDADPLFYYLLVGILNSEYEDDRSFVEMYGFTEILPGRITTDRIVSSDGLNFMDFVNNSFRIGNNNSSLDWNHTTPNVLTIRGGIVQSPSGSTFPMTVFRGEFVNGTTYYKGDEVTFNGSSWVYTSSTPSVGVPGDYSPYWSLKAVRGSDGYSGEDGKGIEFIFMRSDSVSSPAQPASNNVDDYVPPGWTDNQLGVNSTYQYEFVAKREKIDGVWGAFSAPKIWARWSFDGNDGIDGKGIEFIFKRTTTATPPAQPAFSYDDDFVPTGWTDDQQGVTDVYQYEFVAKREKVNGSWGVFSAPALWAKYSFNGGDGIDGKGIEFIFMRTTTATPPAQPGHSYADDYVPTGWTDDQQGVTSVYQYEFVAKREKVNGSWGVFSAPALWAKYSFDGDDGVDGAGIEFIFKRSTTTTVPATPTSVNTDDYVPTGWTDNQTGVNTTYPFEFVSRRKKINGDWGAFSAPALWARYSFDGSNAATGVYRGEYDPTKTYYGNPTRVDAVKYNGTYYIAIIKYPDASFINKVPTDTLYWKTFGAQFESVATDLLLSRQIIASEINTATITALGAITAGSFNLGSGKFVVDANGNLTAVGATIKSGSSGQRVEINSASNDMKFFNSSGISAVRLGSNVHGEGYNGIELVGSYIINDGAGFLLFRNGAVQSSLSSAGVSTTGYFQGKYVVLNPIADTLVANGSIFKNTSGVLCFKRDNGTVATITLG